MENENHQLHNQNRRLVGIIILLIIASIHIIGIRKYLSDDLRILYSSYASDFMLPFGMYFLLCISELNIPYLHKWYLKAGLILGITTLLEMLQYFGIYALGSTFDPIDLIAYIAGVGLAVFFDRVVFKQLIPNWEL